jgi:hypothetical protein
VCTCTFDAKGKVIKLCRVAKRLTTGCRFGCVPSIYTKQGQVYAAHLDAARAAANNR